jgi:hypothetical protein
MVKAKLTLIVAIGLMLVGCDQCQNSVVPAPTPPTDQPTTAAPRETPYTDATFEVGRDRGAPGDDAYNRVSCNNINFPFIIKNASKPLHWQAQPDSTAPSVTVSPAEGDLVPGHEEVVRVKGTFNGKSGAQFSVKIFSQQAASISFRLDLTCI